MHAPRGARHREPTKLASELLALVYRSEHLVAEDIMYWSHHYWGMHMFWWIFWLAIMFWVFSRGWPMAMRRGDSAIEELRRTYASGQISEEEYRRRLAVLTERRSQPAPPSDEQQSRPAS